MSETWVSLADARQLAVDILVAHHTSDENAKSVARALVAAEADGQKGHGLSRLSSYAAQAASGKVDGHARASVVAQKGASLRIDAATGFAFPAFDLAIAELGAISKQNGLAAAGIYRSHHFGQAGYHVERLAEQGRVAMVFGNSPQAIAPWGGDRGVFGTNPIAFAAPRDNDLPLLIDLSLSRVARGKVMLAKQRGESIPDNWALDEHGKATTDPEAALRGTMLPMGDAKGAALVLMVEILAAALTGGQFGFEASSFFDAKGEPPQVGQLLLAFDPDFFSGGDFSARLEALLAEIGKQDGVRLPGSRRGELRAAAERNGLCLDENLLSALQQLAG